MDNILMEKLREAKETPWSKRTKEQRELLKKWRDSPTYNKLFKK